MSYYAVLTELGATLIEQAYQAGRVIEISHMAIGDGNGVEVEPSTDAISIAGEFDRVPLTSGASLSAMIGGGVDYESGVHAGKWIRTLGLIDTEGNLIVYANCTPSLIVSQSETLFSAISLNVQLPIVNGDAVTVIVERPPYPPATPNSPGVVRFATEAETLEGDVPDAAVAPRELAAALALKSDSDHTHALTLTGDVSGSATLGPNGATMTVAVNDDSHGHSIGTIDGLQNALDNKAASGHTHSLTLTGDVSGSATLGQNGATMTVAVNDDSHGHSIGTIDGLQNALDNKAASGHTHSLTLTGDVSGSATLGQNGATMTVAVNDDSHRHSIGTIDGLQNALDNKAAKSHVHNAAQGNADIVASGYEQVGTYGILYNPSVSWIVPGTLVAGSSLRYATLDGATVDNGAPPAGTWKALTYAGLSKTAFFIRVA